MKQNDCFLNYYKALGHAFKKTLEESRPERKVTSIHRLRVAIKKIHALFHLLAFSNHHFDSYKAFNSYKKVFRRVGKLRDIQVQRFMLETLEKKSKKSFKNLHVRLENEEKGKFKSIDKFFRHQKNDFQQAFKKNTKRIARENFPLHKIKLYLVKQSLKIEKLTSGKPIGEKDLHRLRILLKDYLYNVTFVNESIIKSKTISNQTSNIHDLQDKIGSWHDGLLIQRLSSQKSKSYTSIENKSLQILQRNMVKSNLILITKLKKQFPSMLRNIKNMNEELLRRK